MIGDPLRDAYGYGAARARLPVGRVSRAESADRSAVARLRHACVSISMGGVLLASLLALVSLVVQGVDRQELLILPPTSEDEPLLARAEPPEPDEVEPAPEPIPEPVPLRALEPEPPPAPAPPAPERVRKPEPVQIARVPEPPPEPAPARVRPGVERPRASAPARPAPPRLPEASARPATATPPESSRLARVTPPAPSTARAPIRVASVDPVSERGEAPVRAPDPAPRRPLPPRATRATRSAARRPGLPGVPDSSEPPRSDTHNTRVPRRASRAPAPARGTRVARAPTLPSVTPRGGGRPAPVPARGSAPAAPSRAELHSRSSNGRELRGVPLGSLDACVSDREEDRLKQRLLAARPSPQCASEAGRYRFVETRNLNAFLMWVERAPQRARADRCEELRHAIACVTRSVPR